MRNKKTLGRSPLGRSPTGEPTGEAENQKGVSLIMTVFIMIIILAVVFSMVALMYIEIRVVKNLGNSVVALFAADSGIEKVLYYDNKVIPDGATRGLCAMLSSMLVSSTNPPADPSNPNYCQPDPSAGSIYDEHDIYCNVTPPQPVELASNGCDFDNCKNCQITFDSFVDNGNTEAYHIVATTSDTDFTIESGGAFGGAQRKIQVTMKMASSAEAIIVNNACADPIATPQGSAIAISVLIKTTTGGTISSGTAGLTVVKIYDYPDLGSGRTTPPIATLHLDKSITGGTECIDGDKPNFGDCYFADWSDTTAVNPQGYYVDLYIKDTLATPNDLTITLSPKPDCVTTTATTP